MSIFTKQDIKAKLEKNLKNYQEKIVQWEKVERVKTKEGKDFKVISKNFKNARFTYDWKHHISIYGDSIDINIKNYQLPDDDPRKVKGDTYEITHLDILLTPDEIEMKIKNTIEHYKNHIKSYERQLRDLDQLFDKAVKLVEPIKELLKNETELFSNGYSYPTTLCYALREYIQNALI